MSGPQIIRFKHEVITRERTEFRDGVRTVTRPSVAREVEIEINLTGLFNSIGVKAASSRRGESVLGGGLIKARRITGPRHQSTGEDTRRDRGSHSRT